MGTMINGREVSEILLDNLIKAIEQNNKITAEQNKLLVKYTRWLCWLTIGIGIIGLFQLITMFVK